MPNIELVYTKNKLSKVYNLCKDNLSKEYHKCYKVNDLFTTIQKLKNSKYIQVTNIEYAPLLKTKICFMFSAEFGLIELEEKDESNICI